MIEEGGGNYTASPLLSPSSAMKRLVVVKVAVVLNEVGNVHGHLIDAGVVEFLDIVKSALVLISHEVDGDSFATESTTTTDPVRWNVVLESKFKNTQ